MAKYIFRYIVYSILLYPLLLLVVYIDIGDSFERADYVRVLVAILIVGLLLSITNYYENCISTFTRDLDKYHKGEIDLQTLFHHFIENRMIRTKVCKNSRKYHDYYEEDFIKFLRLEDKSLSKTETNSMVIPFRYRSAFRSFCERLRLRYALDIHTLSMEERLTIFAAKAQPNWLNLEFDYLVQLYQSLPKRYSFNEKIKITRQRLLTIYKYEQIPPFWIKKPEWVVENKEPFCFMYQKDGVDNSVDYIFYHKEKKIEVVVTQTYSVVSPTMNQIS